MISALKYAHSTEHLFGLEKTPDVETCTCPISEILRNLALVLAEGSEANGD
jgi:hypothetical protein